MELTIKSMRPLKVFWAGAFAASLAACATSESQIATSDLNVKTPSAPVYKTDDILGASAAALDALLGQPALSRKEGKGEYRRYALSTCSLIVILYPDDTKKPTVAHAEATAMNTETLKPDLETCLAAG